MQQGIENLKRCLKTLSDQPGVYIMLDAQDQILYVGKAKNLKKRVHSYTQAHRLNARLQRMVASINRVEITTTHTEAEALLLECNLIKKHRPPFNVLLRDDKSFPFIYIDTSHPSPRLEKYRGVKKRPEGISYGPFASTLAVNNTIKILQRAFLLRTCSDPFFARRTRPCLLYQLKLCSAPCVNLISPEDYQVLVNQAKDFLSGKSSAIQKMLAQKMDEASARMDFEQAAIYRDRIRALTSVQQKQTIHFQQIDDADLIIIFRDKGWVVFQVTTIRAGQHLGNKIYFNRMDHEDVTGHPEVTLIGQYYQNKTPPACVLLNEPIQEQEVLGQALSLQAERLVEIHIPKRGEKHKLILATLQQAREALSRHVADLGKHKEYLDQLEQILPVQGLIQRIEIYDNSHIMGQQAYGAMVVYGPEGWQKNAYRKFIIAKTIKAGDDYAMMRHVLGRRFRNAQDEPNLLPDLIIIDGGKGQLNAAATVLQELGLEKIRLIAVSKGPNRHAGLETLHFLDRDPLNLAPNDPILYFIQRLRDEAHRFAITTHRHRRSKDLQKSSLDEIEGIGARRKKALLNHFGSAKMVTEAGIDDLAKVPGISHGLAQKIYDQLHS